MLKKCRHFIKMCIFFSLIFFGLSVNGLKNVKSFCYKKDVLEYFQYTSSLYQFQKINLNIEKCFEICRNVFMPFAALSSDNDCKCAYNVQENSIQSFKQVKNELCKQPSSNFVEVYEEPLLSKISNIKIEAFPEIALVDENVNVNISFKKVDKKVNLQFSVDFGDGGGFLNWTHSKKFTYIYRGSSYYEIKVKGKEINNQNFSFILTSMTIQVAENIIFSDAQFTCSSIVSPLQDANCTVTIFVGQNVNGTVDFGDETPPQNFNISDVIYSPFGNYVRIPQIKHTNASPVNKMFFINEAATSLQSKGIIRAIEGYGIHSGSFEFIIYRPFCGQNVQCLNPPSLCSPPKVYCLKNESCIEPVLKKRFDKKSDCKKPTNFFSEYKLVRRVRISFKEAGYFFLKLSRNREYKAGDLVAIKPNNTEIASLNSAELETADSFIFLDSVYNDPPKMIKFSQLNRSKAKLMIRVISYESTEFKLLHNFSNNGVYHVKFTLKSPWAVSNYVYSAKVLVETPIEQVSVQTLLWAQVGKKVNVGIKLEKGSNVNLLWNYGNGLTSEQNVTLIDKNQTYVKSTIYSNPGLYKILVIAKNLQNKVEAHHRLTVQYPVTNDWYLNSNSPQLLPGKVTFRLMLNLTSFGKNKLLPTNATAKLFFGDGQNVTWSIPYNLKFFKDGLVEFQHEYQKTGNYDASVLISNLVSSISLKTHVYVLKRITDFQVHTEFLNKKGAKVKSLELNEIRVPTDSQITFYFSLKSGDVEKFITFLDGKLFRESKKNLLQFTSNKVGWHHFKFQAHNNIQGSSKIIEKKVYFMKPYSNFSIEDVTNGTHTSRVKVFSISFSDIGTDVCLIVDFGDNQVESNYLAYGKKQTCLDMFPNFKHKYIDVLRPKFFLQHYYKKHGSYLIKIWIVNHVTEKAVFKYSFTIMETNCKPPVIWIINSHENFQKSNEIWQSKPVKLYARTKVDCNESVTVNKYWEAFVLDPKTGNVTQTVDLMSLDAKKKTLLYIQPFFLKIGIFKFQFSINITSVFNQFLPLHQHAFTYVKIVPSPIIGRLTKGAETRVVRGYGQQLHLSPNTESFDPDDESNKNFTITWFCRRMPNEKIDRSLADKDHIVTNPYRSRNSNSSEVDLGGCFGQGPGRINITEGFLNWSTSLFYQPGNYEIIIRLTSPDRKPSWAGVQLVLLKGSPPSITIVCQTNALCYPNIPLGQLVNPVRVGLIGTCSESCEGKLNYEWSIFGVKENGSEIKLIEAEIYVAGIHEKKMALDIEFFQKYYPLYGDFFAKLTVINENGDKGESDIFLHINQPPIGGKCSFTLGGNLALLDKHNVTCSGWYDPENKPIEHYVFWIKNKKNGVTSLISYGPESFATLILPYGTYIIGVDIKDYGEGSTRVNITQVSTKAPSFQQYNAFINSGILMNLNQSGDQVLMNMISQAISSLMDIPLVDENKVNKRSINESHHKAYSDIEKVANTKAEMLQFVDNIMNVDTLTSLEQIGSVITAIAGKGKTIDNKAKDIIFKLLNKTINLAYNLQLESPQELLNFCFYAVGTMGSIVNRMSEQLVKKKVLPTDQARAWDIEYIVEPADYGEEKEYVFDGKSSLSESLSKVVIENERYKSEEQIRLMVNLTIKLVLTILKNIVVGEKPLEFSAPSGLSLTIEMFNGGSLSNKTIKHKDAIYKFPNICSILESKAQCLGNETLGVMAVSWPSILESFGTGVDYLSANTKTLQLILLDENLEIIDVKNTKEPFLIVIPRYQEENENFNTSQDFIVPELKFYEYMVYHQFMVSKPYSAVNIYITLTNLNSNILLFISYKYKPTIDSFEMLIPLSAIKDKLINNTYNIFLGNDVIRNRIGFFYIGIATLNHTLLHKNHLNDYFSHVITNFNASQINSSVLAISNLNWIGKKFNTSYFLQTFTSGCYFFDYHLMIWSGEGCFVQEANREMTACKCNHLTSFGGGFFVTPNTINFSYVFANAGFIDNVTIYMAVIVSLFFFSLLLIWARWRDKLDLKQLGAAPMPDNDPCDKYLYEIIVHTGEKEESGTDSLVSFILSGEDDETDVRNLSDSMRKTFRKGSEDRFVMAVPRRLGNLTYLRIWHDNNGKGAMKSWFLSFVVVKDVQTGEHYEFICNKWFAVEKDDGRIDRLIPVTGIKEATQFTHLFRQKTKYNLKDDHLWFSIFMRSPRSRFTRFQRVLCSMSLLYLSMLVNAMWYERVSPKPKSSALEIGPFALSTEQIGIGFMSNLIVFPIVFLIILLFRRSRLRKLRPSRFKETAKKQGLLKDSNEIEFSKQDKTQKSFKKIQNKETTLTKSKSKNIAAKKRKPFLLPWWCKYVALFLCIFSIIVSIFFLWAYAIQFGEEKTRKWITSLTVSIFSSILITQPIKIFLTAILLSTILKSPIERDDVEQDEEEIDFALNKNEEWLHNLNPSHQLRQRSKLYRAPDVKALHRAKLERLKEIKMAKILKEIFSYLFFLWILIVLTYGNRDPNAFLIKNSIKQSFIDGANGRVPFQSVVTTTQLWDYINRTLIPELLVGPWYNGYQPYTLRGFISDRVSRIMGYGMLRQVRIMDETCNVSLKIKRFLNMDQLKCRDFSNIAHESKKNYIEGWIPLNKSTLLNGKSDASFNFLDDNDEEIEKEILTKIPEEDIVLIHPSKSKKTAWQYRKPSELNGLPFLGKLDIYSGGGYTLALRGSRKKLQEKILKLKNYHWIDARTRAVFMEFSIYNPQVNLFGIVSIIAEFQPGGGIIPNHRIDVVRLIKYHQGFGLFIILCECFYLGFLVYFTTREIKNWKQEGRNYFKSYWNWAELLIIFFSYIAIGLYIYRLIITLKILKIFNRTHGNGYVKLQFVATLDEVFGYSMAFINFIAIIKFIRLLRFNKRMGLLYSTLNQCSQDLRSFGIVFLIVFFAFVEMFYIIFGNQIRDFSSFIYSIESTFGMVTGKFNFYQMHQASPFLGPLSFFIFILIAQIILLNIFLTLIISAFESVKHDIMKQNNEFEIVEFMLKKLKEFLGFSVLDNSNSETIQTENSNNSEIINTLPQKVGLLLEHFVSLKSDGRLNDVENLAINNLFKDNNNCFRSLINAKSLGINDDVQPKKAWDYRKEKKHSDRKFSFLREHGLANCTVFDWIELSDLDH